MCFIATKSDTDKLRNSRKRIFWKIVKKNRKPSIYTSDLTSKKVHYRKGRWAHSDAIWKYPDKLKFQILQRAITRKMSKGIYVYSERPQKSALLLGEMIIKVHAEPQDLIGAVRKIACFMKVKVLT